MIALDLDCFGIYFKHECIKLKIMIRENIL